MLREERCSLAAHKAEQEGSHEHNVEADADVGQKLNIKDIIGLKKRLKPMPDVGQKLNIKDIIGLKKRGSRWQCRSKTE